MFDIQNKSGGTVELTIYDVIGVDKWTGTGVSSKQIADVLSANKSARKIIVNINSPGGSVFEALAIYNALERHQARVVVNIDAMALSAASIIAMAGDEIRIAENAMLMIHDPVGALVGTAAEIRRLANLLDKSKETLVTTYASRTKQKPDRIRAWMKAETWLSAEEAVEKGFADTVTAAKTVSNLGDSLSAMAGLPSIAASYRKAPDWLRVAAVAAAAMPRRQPTANDFARAVDDLVEDEGISKSEATKRVAHEQPHLYKAAKASKAYPKGVRPTKP